VALRVSCPFCIKTWMTCVVSGAVLMKVANQAVPEWLLIICDMWDFLKTKSKSGLFVHRHGVLSHPEIPLSC